MLMLFRCVVLSSEWDYTSQEWKTLSVSHKKELTEVKKIVGRAFNQLGTDASGLRMFQERYREFNCILIPHISVPEVK